MLIPTLPRAAMKDEFRKRQVANVTQSHYRIGSVDNNEPLAVRTHADGQRNWHVLTQRTFLPIR